MDGFVAGGETVRPQHLYLHVPFCREHCPYCDYPVLVSSDAVSGPWLQAVARERDLRRTSGVRLDDVRTVLVGGGTPSLFGPTLSMLADDVLAEASGIEEWTVEANPEDISDEVVEAWAAAGVTRVSLGVQSLRPDALRWLGRRHDPAGALRAMDVLGRAPLRTWSVDLIFGLPTAVDPDPVAPIHRALHERAVPHVGLFELTLDETRASAQSWAASAELPDSDELADLYLRFHEALTSMGYEAYQMTSFARPGHASAHADGILQSGSWLGLGPGAHSRLGGLRTWNLLDWGGYTSAIGEGELPVQRAERAGPTELEEERISAILTRSVGMPVHALQERQLALVERWAHDGHAVREGPTIRLTPSGWLLLDRLAHELAVLREVR